MPYNLALSKIGNSTKALLFSFFLLIAQVAKSDVISFKAADQHFHASKTSKKLDYTDALGPRSLAITACNRHLIQTFWNDLVKNYKSSKFKNASSKYSKGVVTYNKTERGLLGPESSFAFFKNVPNNIHLLFVEAQKSCPSK